MSDLAPVLLVAGTRPEALKLAPVLKAFQADGLPISGLLATTGQHHELLDMTLTALGIRADLSVDVFRPGQDLSELVARIITEMSGLLSEVRPGGVVVQGDTATAFGTALAAFLHQIPIFHVESGLRTGRLDQPFPEEAFRQMLARIVDVHFAPTARAARALSSEGIASTRVVITGNTIVDTLRQQISNAGPERAELRTLPWDTHRIIFLTVHRRENHGANFQRIADQAVDLVKQYEDLVVLVARHPNPAIAATLRDLDEAALCLAGRLKVVHPLSYDDVMFVLERCWLVATDSGGLQEEAPSFRRPVLVLREATERPEGVEAGISRVVGTDLKGGVEAALNGTFEWAPGTPNPYGDGFAGSRIAASICDWLNARAKLAPPL